MEIEKNREELFGEIQGWFDDVKESFLSWIAEGERRSKFTGMYMEIDLGWLKICVEEVREEILEDEGSEKNTQLLCRLIHLKGRVKLLNSLVGEFLKKLEGASTKSGDSELEVGGVSSKESPCDFAHTKVNDQRYSYATMGSSIATFQEKPLIIVNRISQKEKNDFDPDERKTDLNVTVVLPGDGRDRAGRKKREFGAELGLDLDQLRPPPWLRGVKEDGIEQDIEQEDGTNEIQEDAIESKFEEELLDLPEKTVSQEGGDDVDSDKVESIDERSGAETSEDDSNGVFIPELKSDANKEDEFEADKSLTRLGMDDARPIDGCGCERIDLKTARTMPEKRAVDLNTIVPGVESNATLSLRWHREELERKFEKMVTMAAREVQSTEAVWVVGLKLQEPVFLLVMGVAKSGCESEFTLKPVGPPPCFNDVSKKWEMDYKQIGLSLAPLGPISWPNSLLSESEPISLQSSHGPKEEKYERETQALKTRDNSLRLPPDSSSSQAHQHRNFEPRPTTGPPPQPPNLPPNSSRLAFSTTASGSLSIPYPISVHICGKVDAAGDDPGDGRFHQFPASLASNLDFTSGLEGKADFKGLARALITTREGYHIEDCSFVLPPPAEPPPKPSDWVSMHINATYFISLQLSGRKNTASIDPGDKAQRFNGEGNLYSQRVGEAGCYGAFGCILQPGTYLQSDLALNTRSQIYRTVKWPSSGVALNTSKLELQDCDSLLQFLNNPPKSDSLLYEIQP